MNEYEIPIGFSLFLWIDKLCDFFRQQTQIKINVLFISRSLQSDSLKCPSICLQHMYDIGSVQLATIDIHYNVLNSETEVSEYPN